MLKIIKMEEATENKGDFAVWNTVTGSFIEDGFLDTVFSREWFEKSGIDNEIKKRVLNLLDGEK